MPVSRNCSARRSLKTRSGKSKCFHRYSKKAADKALQTNSVIARIGLNDKNMAVQRKCFLRMKTPVSKNEKEKSCDQLPNSPLQEVILNEEPDNNCFYIQVQDHNLLSPANENILHPCTLVEDLHTRKSSEKPNLRSAKCDHRTRNMSSSILQVEQNGIFKCKEDDQEFLDNPLCEIKGNLCSESITGKSASPKRKVDQTKVDLTSNVGCNNDLSGGICALFNVHNNVEIHCSTPLANVEQVQTLLTTPNTSLSPTCKQPKNKGTAKAHVTSKCPNSPSNLPTLNRNNINPRRSSRHTSDHQHSKIESPSKSKSDIVNDCAHCDLLTEYYVDDRPSSSAIHQCDDDWSSDVECQNGSRALNITQVCQQMDLDRWMLEQNGFTECKVGQKLSRETRRLWQNVDKIVLIAKYKKRKELLGNCISLRHLYR